MSTIKPATGWALCDRSGIRIYSVRRTRTDAIKQLTGSYDDGPSSRWSYWRRNGFRAIRVNVTAVR